MREPVKLPFKHPKVNAIVCAAFPDAKTKRPVKIEYRTGVRVADYWDGGSRNYFAFVKLDDMASLSSDALPDEVRQKVANPYNLPIADVTIQPGFAVVEHVIFCGKDLGYRVYLSAEDITKHLPEANSLLPNSCLLPELTD